MNNKLDCGHLPKKETLIQGWNVKERVDVYSPIEKLTTWHMFQVRLPIFTLAVPKKLHFDTQLLKLLTF